MAKILIVSFSYLDRDPRVSRQIQFLSKQHEVWSVGYTPLRGFTHQFYKIKPRPLTKLRKVKWGLLLLTRQFKAYYNDTHFFDEVKIELKQKHFDLIIANDIDALPFCHEIRNNARLIFDAHEYFPLEFEDQFIWRLLFRPAIMHFARKNIHQVDLMMTVSDGIARAYYHLFGFMPRILTNATAYYDLSPSPVSRPVQLVHHGIANPSRKIENMIEVARNLQEGFHLTLMLVVPESAGKRSRNYYSYIKHEVDKTPNVSLENPVDWDQIAPRTNQFDIGIFLLEPENFNYRYALPNKLFEFIQARLAVAIGPSPDMCKVVKNYNLGVVAKDFMPKTLAQEINNLSIDDIQQYKQNAHLHAYELSARANGEKLLHWVEEVLAKK